MNRREFSRTVAGAALGAAVLPSAPPLLAADMQVPFKLSVMLWTLPRHLPLDQRMQMASDAGYRYVELTGEYLQWSPSDFGVMTGKLHSLNLQVDTLGGFHHAPADPAQGDAVIAELNQLLPYTDRIGCSRFIILSGNRIPGMAPERQRQALVDTLKRMGDIAAPKNVTILLENIDPQENPKYFLTSSSEGFDIIREVNHPNVRFLYDFYHEQISFGNLTKKLQENIDIIDLVHIADVPGRHEPGTGEIDYANLFRKLAALNYNRYAAMEFLPTIEPVASLRGAREYLQKSLNTPAVPNSTLV